MSNKNLLALVLRHFRCIGAIEKFALYNTRSLSISIAVNTKFYVFVNMGLTINFTQHVKAAGDTLAFLKFNLTSFTELSNYFLCKYSARE